jgi:tryptophan-rich sensory protein
MVRSLFKAPNDRFLENATLAPCAGEEGFALSRDGPYLRENLTALAGFVLLCFAVAGLGGLATSSGVDAWYPTLVKPGFNPPDWVFGPVWTLLYLLMAIAAWRVWRRPPSRLRSAAFASFGLQLALNLGWSVLFFGLRAPGAALVEIVLLLAAIAWTTRLFWRQDRPSGLLFVPYLLWVAFAAVLNASIWLLN